MLRASNSPDECVTAEHRGKLAYIYVRQSSVNQVRHHQESTELQYRLIDRAVALGWPHERVHVIDEDLGKSGSGSVEREGFKKLIAEIWLGNAGLVHVRHNRRLTNHCLNGNHQSDPKVSVSVQRACANERLDAPRTATNRCACRVLPDSRSTTTVTVSPA